MSNDCTWLKQIKPVAKYVGYVARGLGCLLVQNTKYIFAVEHVNPMALVRITSGELNEAHLLQGFSNMFSWNWQWRAKCQSKNYYMMRFPNKAKLVELTKFGKFNLLGTGAVVKVTNWTLDTRVKGKLHTI